MASRPEYDFFCDTGTSNIKLFEIVFVDKNSACCYGVVGAGSAFCLKLGCEVKAHGERKIFAEHDEKSQLVVGIHRNSDSAFSHPSLLEWKRVFDPVISVWNGKNCP